MEKTYTTVPVLPPQIISQFEGRLNHQTDVLALQQEELDKQRQELDDIKKQLQTQALSISQRFSQQDMTLFQHGESITQHAKSIKSNEVFPLLIYFRYQTQMVFQILI